MIIITKLFAVIIVLGLGLRMMFLIVSENGRKNKVGKATGKK